MPIEIKELQIKISVGNGEEQTDNQPSGESEKESIISACVEQVMEILSKKEER